MNVGVGVSGDVGVGVGGSVRVGVGAVLLLLMLSVLREALLCWRWPQRCRWGSLVVARYCWCWCWCRR